MDDLQSSGPVIDQTLKELATINRLLGGNHVTLLGLKELIKSDQALHIVDIGCGGGDMLIQMAKWGRKKNYNLTFTGVDANPSIVEYARKHTSDFNEIQYCCCDVFSEEFNQLDCDIVTATLFTHHFTDQELVDLLNTIRNKAKLGLVINDIHRHWFAYHSIRILTNILSRSEMVRNDAAVSVKRSFSRSELAALLYKSGIHGFDMSWHWAFRWKVVASWG